MPSFIQLLGIAAIILALTGPLSYCETQSVANKMAIKRICIEMKARWNSWDDYCDFSPPKP